ncbi:MAG: hypothetical protein H6609_01585 [Ignavibacteriales bacterium]|nr:hypothetical protein [Ignavibacteriales bacterium]
MQKLSFIILILFAQIILAQSPHGKNFNINCEECHSTDKWDIDYKKLKFDHSITDFELVGQHAALDCRTCHQTIEFSNVKQECVSCHTDIHQNSVGTDCAQCHTSQSWLVKDINEIHRMGRFPLEGAHRLADCEDCHSSVKNLYFEPLGAECFDCHKSDFESAKQPDHIAAGFSTECQDCHQLTDYEWSGALVNHDFFPLTGGHKISNCFDCHSQNTFEGLSQDCITCHQSDFNSTADPNHIASGFSNDCMECHTTNPGWQPATFAQHDNFFQLVGAHKLIESDCAKCHTTGFTNTPNQCSDCHINNYNNTADPNHQAAGFGTDCESCHTSNAWQPATFDHDNQFFPIYSGSHKGEWNECSDCHTNASNFQVFECITCHEHNQNDMNEEHNGVNGYVYESNACYSCHPTGSGEGGFNHSTTNFPLTGVHITTQCSDCHTSGYSGTSMECNSCHLTDFQNTANPNHQQLGLDQNCEQCHTTNPNWQPANFPVHNEFYLIEGAHVSIANDCNSCHNGDYVNNKNQCYDCHVNNYTNTTNPNHQSTGFGTDCETCHSQNAWEPATFDHDNQFFPIYSGKHNNQWNECSDCHTNTSNFQIFECINCHEHNQTEMDDKHKEVQGYQYISTECLACHPSGDTEGAFNHATSQFPLTGAHVTTECSDCHTSGYAGTSMECNACHLTDFQNTVNPNHQQLGLETNCETCHTTNRNWEPATFPVHNDFYLIEGAHVNITNDCTKCHTNEFANTGNQCMDCHITNYNNTSDPNHQSTGFGTDCETCHSQNAWEPATFDHDNQFFPIYSGKHNNEWNDCSDCHTNSSNYQIFECINCHEHNQTEMDDEHKEVQGYQYVSTECLACHPSGDSDGAFNHATSLFPLTGAHTTQECSSCHETGYSNASAECESCHQSDFTNSLEPKHSEAGISTQCENCHNSSAWKPSEFNHTITGFELVGGHNRTQCSDCHSVSTANASSECYGCHESNYSQAPEHSTQNYPKTCQNCHNTTNWEETSFDHNSTNFALTGAHIDVTCDNCHSNGYAGTSTDCNSCHTSDFNNSTNPNHTNLGLSTDCADCHTTNSNWQPASFSVHNNYYALVGAHSSISNDCSTCHNGDYNNTSNQCYDCHQNDYNSTTNPAHASSGFGTGCLDCHSQSAWTPSTFDHDGQYFPIYSGDHRGEWNTCSDCHKNSNDFGQFTCLECHEHSQSRMDDKHSDINDYVYDSNACYDCHPRGQGDIMIKKYFDKMRIEK